MDNLDDMRNTSQWPNTKAKRTNNDLQNIHIILKIEKHQPK
jgi:hypothetical protein